ncbi:hypothetical protein N7468_009137 [Penicillium chermesinum]|uniref:Methyltransferase domain-containing protein n=1 Tax=Penicillium chermesinum TaxID=63820 RepID=A0A9W9TER2_9EURO|nr:uncharacterized protein N7468_009137 [Penicillium chermesinum]KAJ5219933.1 hypothetical protein N7468_009137 [Penicillium chermesinum]
MTTPSHVENYDPSNFWTTPARNFRTSARLHLQHFLFQNTIGFLIEPSIEEHLATLSQPLKIADLACGNGVWLTELHTHLGDKVSAQLDGFDINPVNFPAPAFLPASVKLQQRDVLAEPLSAEMIGTYDVVHIRAFVSIVPDGNVGPILAVASKLLKPGGFIQWDESRGDIWMVESPSPQVSTSACESIVQVLWSGQKARNISDKWVEGLDKLLDKSGFQDSRLLAREKRKQDYKGWTEDYLIVWEELASYFPTKSEAPDAPLSRESWLDMFAAAVRETEQGVAVHQGRVFVAVGQKPY